MSDKDESLEVTTNAPVDIEGNGDGSVPAESRCVGWIGLRPALIRRIARVGCFGHWPLFSNITP
jgi:hypothetical protein